ncbi:histidine kinase dimerization/phospho-acceptor domain-containing protein [Microbacterium albipurpureum]|uniref:histidine kinase dimerization/phospho-acceptor domain-containing protein n=1 Tax=Microbacterium albipurpureum TaxID=3050384 RepID=UPI002FDD8DB9
MDTTQLALLALLAGVVIGALLSGIVLISMRARDRLRAADSRELPEGMSEVLHGMDDPAVVVDNSFTVLAASASAAPFHLREGAALPGDDLRVLVRKMKDDATSASATLRLQRGAPPAEPRLVSVRATRISPRLTLLVLRDITERERVEQMRRDFVANTSHELKTPVGAVSLLAEAIESAADDPDQVRVFSSRLTAEANRLALLTSRIMNLSRLQSADEALRGAQRVGRRGHRLRGRRAHPAGGIR